MILGGNIFGRYCNEAKTQALMDRAWQLGVRGVDTSDSYSVGLSEKFIAKALDNNDWWVATKCGMESDESAEGTASFDRVMTKARMSLTRLGVERIDLYQVHNYDPATPLEETAQAMADLVSEGIIRTWGVCNFRLSELKAIYKVSTVALESVQLKLNYYEREEFEEVRGFCADNGICVLAYGVLGRGTLTKKYVNGIPAKSRAADSESVLHDVNRYRVEHTVAWYIDWVKRQGGEPIVGVRNIQQLEECLDVNSLY